MAYTEFHEPHPICWSILDVVCMEPSISLVHAAAPPHSYRRLPEPCSRFLEATSISIGVLFPASSPSFFHANSRASIAYGLLGWLSLALAAFWVYRMKGFRWFAFSVVAVLQIILMGAFFVAGMAVSGDWL